MMAMPVMQVRPVGVGVHHRLGPVRMQMRILHRRVRVIGRMMGGVVGGRMRVLDRRMGVPVRMALHGEQSDRGGEQRT